jgi:chromosomal replication initiation ATPase DnaA
MAMPVQLPLELPQSPQYGRGDFVVGSSNRDALRLIESWPDWPSALVVLSGPAGSGKTHLTHIWSERSGAEIRSLASLRAGSSARVSRAALAVEDLAPGRAEEGALFHLINTVREGGGSLLLTSRFQVEEWRVELPDLSSRLRLATPLSLGAPDDDLLRQVLVKLFADRQLIIEKAVIDYLLLRMERSLSAAAILVELLDREALAEGRKISRPLAARVLADMMDTGMEFADRQ